MPTAGQLLQHGILEVPSPLPWHMRLRRPDRRIHTVQFQQPLSDREYRSLAAWLSDHPGITLRAWGHVPDLEFLRFFPRLQRFSADTFYEEPESFDGLRHLSPDLRSLVVGATRRRLSLGPLAHFTGLRRSTCTSRPRTSTSSPTSRRCAASRCARSPFRTFRCCCRLPACALWT
jgi:hypothetical protein